MATDSSASDFAANKPKMCFSFRHVQAVLLWQGTMLAYSMRVDMSVAVIAMMGDQHNDTDTQPSSIRSKAVVLTGFMLGNAVTQLCGARLAALGGPKLLAAAGVGGSALCAALIPLGGYDEKYGFVFVCRVMQGLAQGAIYPSIDIIVANWTPVDEKKKVETFISTGVELGVALQFLVSGFILKYWRWSTVFYVNAIAGAVWTLVYVIVGSSSPHTSRFISHMEKEYIVNALKQVNPKSKPPLAPWYALWRSMPVLALILAHCAHCWGLWLAMTLMPLYLHDVQNADIQQIGVISALPFIAMLIMKFPYRCLSNCMINKTCLSVTTTRKIFNAFGSYGPCLALIVLSFATMDLRATAAVLTVTFAMNEATSCGFMLGHGDIAPNFAEPLRSVTHNFGTALSALVPLTAGAMIANEGDPKEWQFVFQLSAAMYFTSNVIYFVFGTSEKQPWNDSNRKNSSLELNLE